jgi:hypothetical protein
MARYDEIHYDYELSRREQSDWYVHDLDPNFRGGYYRGDRMRSYDEEQAAYGRYRATHAEDLGGYGGFRGVYADPDFDPLGGASGHAGGRIYESPWRPYDRGYQDHEARYGWDLTPGTAELQQGRGRGRGRELPPRRGPRELPRGGGMDASRELRRGDGFNRYGGYSSGGFSESDKTG